MSSHQLSKLTNGMIKPPMNPGTGTFSTLHDQNRDTRSSTMQEYYDEDVLAVDQPEPPGFKPVSSVERNPGLVPFEMDRSILTAEFYQKLQDLKKEHKKTLNMLEQLYVEADTRCHEAKSGSMNGELKSIRQKTDGVFLTENGNFQSESSRNQIQEEEDDIESDVSLDEESEEDDRQNVRFRETVDMRRYDKQNGHDRYSRIEEMWDDFRLKDYLPPDVIESEDKLREKMRERPKSAPVKKTKTWSPVITIPKPFKMTIRAENKKEKSHTRSSEEVARATRERMEREELELQRRIRPKDPPAHTFVPLYQEITERQEERSRMNRENASRALQAMVRPFSFMERERQKEEMKNEMKQKEKKKAKLKLKSMTQFAANPVPSCVYDPTISDRIKEDKLYRKIKVKLRSEDLMRSSALPPRMQSHEMMYAERRKKRNKDIQRANKLSFRPQTHDMPDFEALHRREQMEKSARKMELETTITEPFELRTTALRKRKMAMEAANRKIQEEDQNYRKSVNELKDRKRVPSMTDSIPTRLTESARVRIEDTKRALARAEKELVELKEQDRIRKERRKIMAREVYARAMATDRDFTDPDNYRKERLRQYQKQQKVRFNEYQQELKNMNDRIKQRPLLFEQQAQNSARNQAEKRYQEILRSSGLSDDFVEDQSGKMRGGNRTASIEDDYSDEDFETSIIQSGPKPSQTSNLEDSESDVEEEIYSEVDEEEEPTQSSSQKVKKHLDFDI